VWLKHIRSNPRQLLRSWYVFLFQLPWLPEAIFRRRNWRAAAQGLVNTSRPGTFRDEELEIYRQAWSQPGAMRSMLNWYRAALRNRPRRAQDPSIAAPTLLLWGVQDRFAGRELAQASIALCPHGELVYFEDATHWVQHEEPARVNAEIARFFAAE
jgi:pimeloyl-ACP methyl ester carboxylesterase